MTRQKKNANRIRDVPCAVVAHDWWIFHYNCTFGVDLKHEQCANYTLHFAPAAYTERRISNALHYLFTSCESSSSVAASFCLCFQMNSPDNSIHVNRFMYDSDGLSEREMYDNSCVLCFIQNFLNTVGLVKLHV